MTCPRTPPADAMQTARFALEELRENLPLFIELMEIQGKMAKAKFDAFVSAGFTPQQALELTKEDVRN